MESDINSKVPNPSKPVGTLLKNATLFEYHIISLDGDKVSLCFHVSCGCNEFQNLNGLMKFLWPQLNHVSMKRL